MLYNNNKYIDSFKKNVLVNILCLCVVFGIAVILWVVLTPYAKNAVKDMGTNEVIASGALFISLIMLAMNISEKILLKNYNAKKKLTVDVSIVKDNVIITSKIGNLGRKRIIPHKIYLILEEGIIKDDQVCFPYILKHEKDDKDCILANICKKGEISDIPLCYIEREFHNKYRKVIPLKHLSKETIMYIDPGEEMSEDVTVKLNKGYYQVSVLWFSINDDCICTTKQFVVDKK